MVKNKSKFCNSKIFNENFRCVTCFFLLLVKLRTIVSRVESLSTEGFIKELIMEQGTKRTQKRYQITDEGLNALKQWLKLPVEKESIRLEILLKMYFSNLVDEEVMMQHIRIFQQSHQQDLMILNMFEKELKAIINQDPNHGHVISGSVMLFVAMILTAIFFGRAWCAWICPMAGVGEIGMSINNKNVSVKKLKIIRYSIFMIWFGILVAGFVLAGGIKQIIPLHLTETGISVDQPMKYVIYYFVLFTFFTLNVTLGKRGACHSICWMSPFLVAGTKIGRVLHLPQLRITTMAEKCIDCKKCDVKCPMSITVSSEVKLGKVESLDCILCGECVDVCPKKVLQYDI